MRTLTILCVALSVTATFAQQKPQQSDLRTLLDQRAPALLKQYNVPSVAIAYIRDGRVDFTAVYGEQSPGVPATQATLYNIASLTKPITAETVLRLASKGVLSLDEPMSPFWLDPDIKDDPRAALLTPRICLSHQTGFANWRSMTNGRLTFKFEPGSQVSYSGEGYNYVAHFAESKTHESLDALAQANVFDAIGMKDTAYTVRPWFTGRLASARTDKGNIDPETTTHWVAADLVRTTISDYAKFVVSVMHNEGVTPAIAAQRLTFAHDMVSADDKKKFCPLVAPGVTDCTLSVGMGLGWEIIHMSSEHSKPETIVVHSGADTGVHTLAFFVPDLQMGAVLFTNGEEGMKLIGDLVPVIYSNKVFIATLH